MRPVNTSKRQNILLISMDDAVSFWHYKDVFGVPLSTPNLDRICTQSTAFHAAYCQSPLCGPSRASFMSGKTPPQTGVLDNKTDIFSRIPAQDMWQVRLKQAGYFCSSGGKVHHGFKPVAEAAHKVLYSDERKWFRIDVTLRPEFAQSRSGGNGGGISTLDPADDGYYHDAQSAESCVDFLDTYQGDAPFYREVGFYSPHSPFITPVRFKDLYPLHKFRYPQAWSDGFNRSEYSNANIRKNFRTQRKRNWAKSVRNYFSAYSHGDHHLGRVWDALKASRFAQNTIVVIVTDHGYHLGEGNRFGKSTLWEQSALVPIIIHDPSDAVPRAVKTPVALLDVGPTVLDYANAPPLHDCAGLSLRDVVNGAPGDPHRAVPTFTPHGTSVRYANHRFIRYKDGSTELFNLEKDWWQQDMLGCDHSDYAKMDQIHANCSLMYGKESAASQRASQAQQTKTV